MKTVECTYCGSECQKKEGIIKNSKTGRFYCCKECQHADRRGNVLWNYKGGGVDVKCKQCDITFKKDRHKVESRDKDHFCSMECLTDYRKEQSKDKDIRKQIRNLKKYKEWRYAIFEKDNYECQECGSNEHLDAHHLKDFWTLIQENNITTVEEAIACDALWNLDNGQTLCVYHHAEKHPRNKNLILKRVA